MHARLSLDRAILGAHLGSSRCGGIRGVQILALRTLMMAVLVAVMLLSVGLPDAFAGTLDNNYPAAGYPADIVRTGVKSRATLAANFPIYQTFGMDRNFIYYSNDRDLSANTSVRWGGQPGYNYGDAWADTIFGTGYWFTPIQNCIANAQYQTFRAFEWNGTFVACVCGNMSWGITNPPPPSISGSVWNDLNGNGSRDAGEPVLSSKAVRLMQGSTQRLVTTTDSNGNFAFTVDANAGLLPGTYSLALQALSPGWNLTRAPGSTTIAEGSANAGRNFSGNDFGLHLNTYTLTYTAGPGGSISGASPQTVNHGADGTEVTAVPAPGYHFVGWSDDPAVTAARTETNVTADKSVTASFAINTVLKGWMTGGGSIQGPDGTLVTHGFELYGDPAHSPNNLEVNWGTGNQFHLESLESAMCYDDLAIDPESPAAGFDTYRGTGIGRLNGVSGYIIEWTFTDEGEPGTKDHATILIKDPGGSVVLSASGNLLGGNHQAHSRAQISTGPDVTVQAGEATVTFPSVTVEGTLTVTQYAPRQAGPDDYRIVPNLYFDIHPSATFVGPATVTLSLPPDYEGDLSKLKVFHWVGTGWKTLACSVDVDARTVTFQTDSFSDFALAEPSTLRRIWRFRSNSMVGSYLWTIDPSEMASIRANLSNAWTYEGPAFTNNGANPVNADVMVRFRNKQDSSYFWTADPVEIANLRDNLGATWALEGPAWRVSRTPTPVPVWRFRCLHNSTHLWTIDPNEKQTIVNTLQATYALEGVAYYLGQ